MTEPSPGRELVSVEATRAAYEAHRQTLGKIPLGWDRLLPEARAAWNAAVEAAAPHIAAAERQRIIADTFGGQDARLGLFKLAAADGALRERERIAKLAEQVSAYFTECSAYERPFADLIREGTSS